MGMGLWKHTNAYFGAASLMLLLVACNSGNNDGLSVADFGPLPENATVQPGGAAPAAGEGGETQPSSPPDPATNTPTQPVVGNQIQSTNVHLLTGASLDTLTKLITAGNIATVMVMDGSRLITDPNTRSGASVPVSQCQNDNNFGPDNRFSFAVFAPGNFLPPGKNLNANFSECNIESALVSGFMDLSGIIVTGAPDDPNGDWSVSGLLSFGSLDFLNDDGTSTTFSNNLSYRAVKQNGVLTVTLEVETMNVEHNLNDKVHINYLLEPFSITVVDDSNTGLYTISIAAHPALGQSLVNRYTTNFVPDDQGALSWLPIGDDIELLVSAEANPIRWPGGKPNLFSTAPDGGEILLEEATGSNRINVILDGAGVTLNLDTGATVTGQSTTWADLLARQ